jgi:signal transduction histidine kinase
MQRFAETHATLGHNLVEDWIRSTVTVFDVGTTDIRQFLARNLGVRARLLLAFFGISAFAVLAATVGIYAFREVGDRLDLVDRRVPTTLSSLELSRSAEAIIAAAPALLAATDRQRQDEVKAQLQAEVDRLNAKLVDLKRNQTDVLPLHQIEQIVSSLTDNLTALENLVARRLSIDERIRTLLRGVFQTNDETQRLLAPWLMVMDGQISSLVDSVRKEDPSSGDTGDAARRLSSLVDAQRPAQTAQRQFSAAVDMLAEASTTDQNQRLPILAFQLGRALRDLEGTAAGLDPKLRSLFLEQLVKLREFVQGPNAITNARMRELALVGDGERLLAENTSLSAKLATAVNQLAGAAKRDISDATRDALLVQRVSTRILIIAVALSLLTSVLIVWLYVSRNIVGRLTTLSTGMLSIASGKLDAGVAVHGSDEIAAMGRAIEVFRRNAIDLEQLLEERKQAAERLEHLVEERTKELERRSSALRVTFDHMGHGVVMFDRDQRMVAWNHQFQELLELPDNRVGPDITFEDFIRFLAERGEYGPCDIEEEVERRLSSLDQPFADVRTRPNGVVLEIRRNPVPSGGVVSIYADITAAKQRERELEAARDTAAEASRTIEEAYRELKTTQASLVHAEKMASLGQLTAGIAHEIKNPLNFVNNFADLSQELLAELKEGLSSVLNGLGAEARTDVEDLITMLTGNLSKIAEHGRRADGIVKSMLLHSRGGRGDRQIVDLNALVEETLNLAYHGARAQDQTFNVTLERDLDPNLGPLELVPQDITRVLLNLFGNGFYAAVRRQRDGGAGADFRPVLRVTTRNLGDHVELRVHDNGTGMTPEVRAKLFTPFFTTKPTGEGTGLGLSISYDIVVQQLSGTISVDSCLGEFTEFVIRLPRVAARVGKLQITAGAK